MYAFNLKYYPQPNKFNSERFLDNNMDNSVYMSFSIESRICIDNRFTLIEIKIMLFYLLWRYNLEPDVKIKIPMMLNKKTFFMMVKGDFWLKLSIRKSKTRIIPCLSNRHKVEEAFWWWSILIIHFQPGII